MVINADASHRGQRGWDPGIPATSYDWGSTVHGNNPTTDRATQDLKEQQSRSEVKAKFGPLILKRLYIFMPQMIYKYLFGKNQLESTLWPPREWIKVKMSTWDMLLMQHFWTWFSCTIKSAICQKPDPWGPSKGELRKNAAHASHCCRWDDLFTVWKHSPIPPPSEVKRVLPVIIWFAFPINFLPKLKYSIPKWTKISLLLSFHCLALCNILHDNQ